VRVVNVKELSDFLRVHPSTVYRLVKTGHLPAFRVGDSLRFNLEEIEEWLEQSRRNQRTTPQKLAASSQ
jgi:excisionase family DNA binding protein